MNKTRRILPTENCMMAATVGMLFTALATALAVFVASGALDGVDGAAITALWAAALTLASCCLLLAVAGVALFLIRTGAPRKTAPPRPRGRVGGIRAT